MAACLHDLIIVFAITHLYNIVGLTLWCLWRNAYYQSSTCEFAYWDWVPCWLWAMFRIYAGIWHKRLRNQIRREIFQSHTSDWCIFQMMVGKFILCDIMCYYFIASLLEDEGAPVTWAIVLLVIARCIELLRYTFVVRKPKKPTIDYMKVNLPNLNQWLSDSVDIADQNEFKSQSGWFTFSGMPQDKAALPYVLAKKCRLSYEQFMETKEAVYAFNFMQGEKVLESQYCSDLKALGEGGC